MHRKPLLIIIVILLLFVSCSKKNDNTLIVYAYDSFCSSWGPGTEIVKNFEEKTGIKVQLVSCGGAVELESRLSFEGTHCQADAVIGLASFTPHNTNLYAKWTPENKDNLIEYNINENLIPFNWGVFAFNINTKADIKEPTCLEDLLLPQYKDKFVLIDPRTSSVGLGMLLWTIYAMGEQQAYKWWTQAIDNALTVCSSWSSAYGMFTEGEVPLVLSYSTSPVYHTLYDKDFATKSLKFSNGHIRTVEYLGILKTSKKKALSEKFCNYILGECQSKIALSNTMFPANTKTKLPEAYKCVPQLTLLNSKSEYNSKEVQNFLDRWTVAVVK